MEAYPSYHNYQAPYQTAPCLSERRNENLSPGLEYANETGYTNMLSMSNRFNHALSYPPASGGSPRSHDFQVARAGSRLQTRSSPPTVRMLSRSPELQNTSIFDSSSSLSAFPLPYRPQSASHYVSSLTEYSSPTSVVPLTSQDTHSYYSSPFQASPGKSFGFNDSRSRTISQATSDLEFGIGHGSSPTWQTRDSKWPQSRSQSRRKYVPKGGRRYDYPFSQRRLGSWQGYLGPSKKKPLFHAGGIEKGVRHDYRKRFRGQFYDMTTKPTTGKTTQHPPTLARYPLPSSLLDDQQDAPTYDREPRSGMCLSQYISADNADISLHSIRGTKYWETMKEDPIFSNLSNPSESISITDLIKRRVRILKTHSITKEQGIQTDIERSTFLRPNFQFDTPRTQNKRSSPPSKKPKRELTPSSPPLLSPSPSPFPLPHHKQDRSSNENTGPRKYRNSHYRTASLTDTEAPRLSTPQHASRVAGLKRSRSDTEEDYNNTNTSNTCYRMRAADIPVTSPSPTRFGQRPPQNPFYSKRR